MLARSLVVALVVLAGCDLVPGPVLPNPITPAQPGPNPTKPLPTPNAPGLTGLGNPFADVYSPDGASKKALIQDLAVVDGRVYLGHGSTRSLSVTHPIYYDVRAGRWGSDDVTIHQEATFGLQVGPSGRLYASSDDAQGIDAVLMIRRERDGTWTERIADTPENHSRDTYEWKDPRTGETLVFIQNSAPYFPDVSVSYDDGATFVRYGYKKPSPNVPSLNWYKFFEFKGDLYAASRSSEPIAGRPAPTRRPYLVRYTRNRDRPFEVVSFDRPNVFPGAGSQIEAAVEIGGRLIAASSSFYSGDALTARRMRALPVPGRAVDLVRVGGAVYLLGTDYGAGTSSLYVTRNGVSVKRVATFDHAFDAVEYASGAFYLAESGASSAHSLWRFVPRR